MLQTYTPPSAKYLSALLVLVIVTASAALIAAQPTAAAAVNLSEDAQTLLQATAWVHLKLLYIELPNGVVFPSFFLGLKLFDGNIPPTCVVTGWASTVITMKTTSLHGEHQSRCKHISHLHANSQSWALPCRESYDKVMYDANELEMG